MAEHGNGRRVLVVEDSEVIRRVVSLILQGEGYEVAVAANGEQAVLLAERLAPDVVTLDLSLPDLDGWEVLRRLRAGPSTRDIPVVVISAHADRLTDAERSGAAEVIAKPFDVDMLLDGVNRVLGLTPLGRRKHLN
jgi:CheY-like chemotaxis protein